MKWSDWFQIGYGPAEFHRDVHVAWVVFLTYALTRIPQIRSFTWDQFKEDSLTVGSMIVITIIKSYLGKTQQPGSGS